MPALPIPFVVVLLLLILLLRLHRLAHGRELRPFMVFIGVCALATAIMGLRWSFGLEWARWIQPVIAASVPVLAWVCSAATTGPLRASMAWHGAGVVLVAVLVAVWRAPIDLVLFLLFAGYGAALIRWSRQSADRLERVRLGEVGDAQRAVRAVGWLLVVSALVEAVVGLDFELNGGRWAPWVIAMAGTAQLLALGWVMAWVGKSQAVSQDLPAGAGLMATAAQGGAPVSSEAQSASGPSGAAADGPNPEQAAVMQAFDTLMTGRRFFLDPDLTLERIARRTGIPARQISSAINAVHGRNVSQVVNEYRVAEAQRLLAGTGESVTSILLQSGFQTKSNFNREFRRVTGMSPSDFRAQAATPSRASTA